MRRYLGILKSSLLNELYLDLEARLLYIFYQSANGATISPEVVRDIRGQRPDIVQFLAQQREQGNIAYVFSETIDGVQKDYDFRNVCEFSHTMIPQCSLGRSARCRRRRHVPDLRGRNGAMPHPR